MTDSITCAVRALERIRNLYGADETRNKLEILEKLSRSGFAGEKLVRWLLRYHETLMFLAAYPDDAEVYRAAMAHLRRIPSLVRGSVRAQLVGSGLPGTRTSYPFDRANADWLVRRYPNDVEVDWNAFEEEERLQELLAFMAGPADEVAIDDESVETLDWVKAASEKSSSAEWLIGRFNRIAAGNVLRDTLYNSMNVTIDWKIRDPQFSRTGNRYKKSSIYYHEDGLMRRTPPLAEHMIKPIRAARKLRREDAARLIDIAKAALIVRDREMYPITYADPDHVTLYSLERGLQIVTYGTIPERRLFLEGLWGFLFLKNGIPLGYGCFSALFASADVAFNIFETFRQGESAMAYVQLLRVIHQHTGATTIGVERYQFGHDNDEAIQSGAFWFYHKLGFLPHGKKVLALIARERRKIATRKGYRTPPKILERLAEENLFFHLGNPRLDVLLSAPFSRLGMKITRFVAVRYGSRREDALRAARARAEKILGRLPHDPLTSDFCLLTALIPDLPRWPLASRRDLAAAVRARAGHGGDREFALRLNGHRRFRQTTLNLLTG